MSKAANSQNLDNATMDNFRLPRFYPYRLAVLSDAVSRAFVPLYQSRFDLSRQEWRVLAALAEMDEMSAKEIAAYSTLEKMQTSRAIAQLEDKSLIYRAKSSNDRRQKRIKLTKHGLDIYRKIIPLAKTREEFIMSALSESERAALDQIIDKLVVKARELQELS